MAISLGDRLRQVVNPGHRVVPRVADDALHQDAEAETETPAVAAREARLDGFKAADVLAGHWIETTQGSVLVIDRYYAADRRHGREPIGEIVETLQSHEEALDVLARAWPGRSDRSGGPVSQQFCFFDLETTGLAGGAGTQAFLVGCAVIEDGGIRVRQFLLPGFEHERALLSMVGEWMTNQGTLVTFNGRSFDVPLIETRYLLHRLPFPFAEMPHLDMLHPARRLWKQRPTVAGPPLDDDSCKLSVLERHLAGYHRVGDVPGFEIPSRYYRFIRDGNAYPLEAVLEHNRIDLLSLALVTARALRLIDEGPGAAMHPREALGLGRLYERTGATDNAEACFASAAALAARVGREPDVQGEALRRLALSRRRHGRMAEAAAAWQELLNIPCCPSMLRREAREALAIHHEHRSRDLQAARSMVLDVLAEGSGSRWRDQAEHRLNRIERKLAVRREGGLMAALEE
ncbi:MAG TPA: ribonuclease H-like domain-containing protein [Vicinamibacterales bacterium]|nr:ribonuclease H-like domain-containing protein [Vicinamibacterales bacterium]